VPGAICRSKPSVLRRLTSRSAWLALARLFLIRFLSVAEHRVPLIICSGAFSAKDHVDFGAAAVATLVIFGCATAIAETTSPRVMLLVSGISMCCAGTSSRVPTTLRSARR